MFYIYSINKYGFLADIITSLKKINITIHSRSLINYALSIIIII